MAKTSTQQYLDIAEIRDNTVVLKDGTLRSIILCSSINFALKSEDEQNALIMGYVEFLNSLEHPLQIVVQSRKLDIEEYINRLKEAEKKQANELLRIQINSYLDFINQLVEIGEIMTKRFFLVVPYNPLGNKGKGFFARLKEAFSPSAQIKIKREKFIQYKQELDQRVANIQSSLNSMGLDSATLDTQGLIELFYNIYNPKTSQNQRLRDVSQLGVEIV
ncbi:MAG: TraC family protein [Patescibacteria group bacterium]|nr:TraC family protein [Patescibacteria group bacterium]